MSSPRADEPELLALPTELLQLVLTFACRDGALPTAAYAACVSRVWRDAVRACEAELYRVADFSLGWVNLSPAAASSPLRHPLLRLCGREALAQTRTLRLCTQPLPERVLDRLTACCHRLETLALDDCSDDPGRVRISTAGIIALIAAQPQLASLSLARCELNVCGLEAALHASPAAQPIARRLCGRESSRAQHTVNGVHAADVAGPHGCGLQFDGQATAAASA